MSAPDIGRAAPLPWDTAYSRTATGGGDQGPFHLYLVDANGRKIAAIWGKSDEKLATAELILNAVNGPTP